MLPKDWGQNRGPERYALPADADALRARYGGSGNPTQLEALLSNAVSAGSDAVYVERPYTDLDYRSDYAHFYSRGYRPPPSVAERLIFAANGRVLGFSVMRPLTQRVGRTVVPPPASELQHIRCTMEMSIHAFGHEWPVEGFPFSSQDGEYGVCAHAAVWAITRYHHYKFGGGMHTVSSIIDAAGLREKPDKTARSLGLFAQEIVRAFRGVGLPAVQYSLRSIPQPETPDRVICRYLNSQIPVAVLTHNHMFVVTGYREEPSGEIGYYVCDDNYEAYRYVGPISGQDPDHAWVSLMIPLPGRMHVSGEAAEARAEQVFEDRTGSIPALNALRDRFVQKDPSLRVRLYATTGARYLAGLTARGVPGPVRDHHVYSPTPGWVWVAEFQDSSNGQAGVVGELLVDATSSELDPAPVLGNIGGQAFLWDAGEELPLVADMGTGLLLYASAL